jgi:hypothetical protein
MRQLRPSKAAGSQPMRAMERRTARVKSIERHGCLGSAVGRGDPPGRSVRKRVPQAEQGAEGRAAFEHRGEGNRR